VKNTKGAIKKGGKMRMQEFKLKWQREEMRQDEI
jgi:hypothetical protein